MDFRILGPLQVADGETVPIPGAKERALLAVLLIHVGEVVSAGRLIQALWGEHPPADPANALQARVSYLRKALGRGAGALRTRKPGYVLEVDPEQVDARRFARLAAQARSLLEQDPAQAAALLDQALGLWRGAALAEFADQDFAQAEITRLEELRRAAVEDRIDARLALGAGPQLVGELEALVAEHPLRERLWGQLMRALYRSGRQADALGAYQQARRVLGEELGLDPSPQLQRLQQAILVQDPSLAAAPPLAAPPRHNLPARLSSFVGRHTELQQLGRLLQRHRLVTVTGPGGIGKTSLAVAVAAGLVEQYRDGVWLVELAALREAARLEEAVVAALGLGPGPGDPAGVPAAERLVGYLASRELLLVLDNCEHLLQACAELAVMLLRAAPGLRVLATSRERLQLPGEAVWPTPPLAFPAASASPLVLAGHDAVRLFVERATAARPDFALDVERADAVAEICRRLDGMPLAIELAAARTGMLAVDELAARLDDRFGLLTGGGRAFLPRQQTLRATIDWSYDLLAPPERTLFGRLAVFVGGWTLEAAEQVCAGGELARGQVLDVLGRLVDRSLVTADARAGRFGMLETIRDYARHRLAESGEVEELGDRHARYFLGLAEQAELHGPQQPAWLARLQAEHDNLRAAIDWTLAHRRHDLALRLAGALGWFWFLRHQPEGRRRLAAVLGASPTTRTLQRARALHAAALLESFQPSPASTAAANQALAIFTELGDPKGAAGARLQVGLGLFASGDVAGAIRTCQAATQVLGRLGDAWGEAYGGFYLVWFHTIAGDLDRAIAIGTRSAEVFGGLGDRWARSSMQLLLGIATRLQGQHRQATRLFEESLTVGRELGLSYNVHRALTELAIIAVLEGDLERADRLGQQALAVAQETGYRVGMAMTQTAMGMAAHRRGDPLAARALHRQALGVFGELGVRYWLATALSALGFAEELLGNLDEAERCHQQASTVAHAAGDPLALAAASQGLASLAAHHGQAERAALLLGAAEALRAPGGIPLPGPECLDADQLAQAARSLLGEDRFQQAVARGGRLGAVEAVLAALR